MRPQAPAQRGPKDIDESTDTYDTIDWLVKHVTAAVKSLRAACSLTKATFTPDVSLARNSRPRRIGIPKVSKNRSLPLTSATEVGAGRAPFSRSTARWATSEVG
jgi:hypothetical protein